MYVICLEAGAGRACGTLCDIGTLAFRSFTSCLLHSPGVVTRNVQHPCSDRAWRVVISDILIAHFRLRQGRNVSAGICLSVSGIIQNVVDEFSWNLWMGCGLWLARTGWISVALRLTLR